MHFLIGTVIVLGIFYLLVVSPNFRKAAAILLAAAATVVAGVLLLIFINNQKQDKGEKHEPPVTSTSEYVPEYLRDDSGNAKFDQLTAIKSTDLNLTDVDLIKQNDGQWILKGTVANNSDFNLTGLAFLVTMQDRAAKPSDKNGQKPPIDTLFRHIRLGCSTAA